MTREWFTMYCQNAAANVLDKDGKVRFTYEQLHNALNDIHTDVAINTLHQQIVGLCNAKCGTQSDHSALILTLCNIHAAYLMITGAWKYEQTKPEKDEYGFEIF